MLSILGSQAIVCGYYCLFGMFIIFLRYKLDNYSLIFSTFVLECAVIILFLIKKWLLHLYNTLF